MPSGNSKCPPPAKCINLVRNTKEGVVMLTITQEAFSDNSVPFAHCGFSALPNILGFGVIEPFLLKPNALTPHRSLFKIQVVFF